MKKDFTNQVRTAVQGTSSLLARAAMTLLFALVTTTTAWAQNSPTVHVEGLDGKHGSIYVKGWCEDPDALSTPMTVQVTVKDNNGQPVEGYNPFNLTANLKRFGEDNQWHYNGFDHYLPITTAGTYKVEFLFVDATGDDSPIYYYSGIQVTTPYTVTYDANGGSDAPAQQLKSEGVALTLTSSVPTRDGHNFQRWTTAQNGGGTAYNSGATYTADADATLYAQWVASDFPGSGTAADPYVISTAGQWNLFASNVNNGNSYSGKYFVLGADINVSTMAGTHDTPFAGTFIGNGHTMNLAINATGTGGGHPNIAAAPFRYVNGATFKNINLTGTITRKDYPSDSNVSMGGLIGILWQGRSATITGCRSSVSINYSFSWDTDGTPGAAYFATGHMGGFIGWSDGNATITDCLFDGNLAGRPLHMGGFVGYLCWGKVTFNNCLMNGTGSPTYSTYCRCFFGKDSNGGDGSTNNCYYTDKNNYSGQGSRTSATGETLRAQLGNGWIVNGSGAVVPGLMLTLNANTNNGSAIATAAGAGTTFNRVQIDGLTIYRDGTWNTICLPFNLATLSGTPLAGARLKTLASSNYTTQNDGTLTLDFTDATSIEAGKPYIVKFAPDLVISSTADWNAFANSMGTESYEGKTVVLATDVTADYRVGVYQRFKGTFDGCGHTLTFNKTWNNQESIAPFCTAENATFRNLKIVGTINTSGKFAAGLVAISYGGCTIENCQSSIVINSSINGDGTHGGFIGCCNSGGTVSFVNCLFDGTISGSNTTSCGGFVGWRNASLTFTNCLMAGTMSINQTNSSAIFNRNGGSDLHNCYYKGSFGSLTTQGTPTTATGETLRALLGNGWEVSGDNVVPKMQPTIENPVFTNVALSNATANIETTYASLNGSYKTFSTGLLFDAHNTNRLAMHAALTITQPSKTGYSFGGWYTDAARQNAVATIPFGNDGDITLYAKWNLVTYTLTYKLNGGTNHTDNPATYNIESATITLQEPIKTGYTFGGWFDNEDCTGDAVTTIATGSYGNVTLYAKWTKNELTLTNNNDDNSDMISAAAASGKVWEVTLADRTIYRDGDWNTLCLPFSLASLTGTPLEGFSVKTLTSTTFNDGTLTMNFSDDLTSIEAGKPYIVKGTDDADLIIRTANDWNTFASNVGNYQNKIVKLATDLSVSSMVEGTFNGALDGCGHTITLSLSSGSSAEDIALFNTLGNATIKNLKIAGTITFGKHRPASIASYISGTTTIMNCWSSVSITSNYNPSSADWVDGGAFVARVNSGATINMSDCLFTGSITYKAKNNQGGGMVGWTQGSNSHANLTHCLFAPSSMTMTATDPKSKTYVFVSGEARGNLVGCYYNSVANNVNSSVLKKEGTYTTATGSDLLALLGDGWEIRDGQVVPKMINSVGNIVNPVFTDVTISDAPANVSTTYVDFIGTYAYMGFTADDKSILFLGTESTLYYPLSGARIGACRAYFQLHLDGNQEEVKAFVLNFDEDDATSIDHSPLTIDHYDGTWYDLNGRKLNGKPSGKGIYVNGGRKIVVK